MHCSQKRTDAKIAVAENGKTFRLDNRHHREIIQVKVDGCLITDRERCDWLFEILPPPEAPLPKQRVFYVELKGKNIEKAVDQIRSTIEYTKHQYAAYRKEAYIVSSRVPAASPSSQQKQAQLKRDYATSLVIKTKELLVIVP